MNSLRVLQVANNSTSFGGIASFIERFSLRIAGIGWNSKIVELIDTPEAGSVENAHFKDRDPLKAIKAFSPDIIVSHQAGDASLVRALCASGLPAVEVIHTTLCPGGKFLRRGERECQHAMGIRCYVDWYLGPCGTSKSPVVALSSIAAARRRVRELNHFNAIAVANDWVKRHVIGEGVSSEKVHVIDLREGIGFPLPVRPTDQSTSVQLLSVGRLVKGKGIHNLIDAMKCLPDSYRLRIAGDGWARSQLESQVQRLGIANRVCFLGQLSQREVDQEYASASALVVPSIAPETAGLVVPEARAHGLRVVVTPRGGLQEWVATYGLSGVFIARDTTASGLADAVKRAVDSSKTEHTDSVALERLDELLLSVLVKHKSSYSGS